jgi:hypothetical protein
MKSLIKELFFNQKFYNKTLWEMRYNKRYKQISDNTWDTNSSRQILEIIHMVVVKSYEVSK